MGPIKLNLYLLYIIYTFNNEKVSFLKDKTRAPNKIVLKLIMEILKQKIHEAVNLFKHGNLVKSEKITLKLIETNPKIPFLYNESFGL